MSSSLIFMEPCQGPATCSKLLMKIGWVRSEILWLQVGTGAVLRAKIVHKQPLSGLVDEVFRINPVTRNVSQYGARW